MQSTEGHRCMSGFSEVELCQAEGEDKREDNGECGRTQ